jgi:hypothetical protein
MISMVKFGHRFPDMYVDHDDNLNECSGYNVVAYPAAQSQLIVSPGKLSYVQRQKDEKLHNLFIYLFCEERSVTFYTLRCRARAEIPTMMKMKGKIPTMMKIKAT